MTGLKWTRKTTERIAIALRRQGMAVGRSTVGRLLQQLDFASITRSGRRPRPRIGIGSFA